MRSSSRRRFAFILPMAACAAAVSPSTASAVQVTVTGDDNAPLALGGPVVIRNMSPAVAIAAGVDEQFYFRATYGAPDGVAAASALPCSRGGTRGLEYRGNGRYTASVERFSDSSCGQSAGPPLVYGFTLNAGVALAAPQGRVLIRDPNSYGPRTIMLRATPNPGAVAHEVRYALGGVVGATGAISGASESTVLDTTTGTVPLNVSVPGRYTIVARARGSWTPTGQYFSPWSAPVHVRAVAPFDLASVSFADGLGPSYEMSVQVRERSARGRVYVSCARGYRGGRYRSLGSARLSSSATFSKRFTLRKLGVYRLRFRFNGSATTASGTVVEAARFTRIMYGL